jgi:hypothetical protein
MAKKFNNMDPQSLTIGYELYTKGYRQGDFAGSGRLGLKPKSRPGSHERQQTRDESNFGVPTNPGVRLSLDQAPAKRRRQSNIYGMLQGFDDRTVEKFDAGNEVEVEVRSLGPYIGGVHMLVKANGVALDGAGPGIMYPSESSIHHYETSDIYPVHWEITIWVRGGDRSTYQYFICY